MRNKIEKSPSFNLSLTKNKIEKNYYLSMNNRPKKKISYKLF